MKLTPAAIHCENTSTKNGDPCGKPATTVVIDGIRQNPACPHHAHLAGIANTVSLDEIHASMRLQNAHDQAHDTLTRLTHLPRADRAQIAAAGLLAFVLSELEAEAS